MSGTDSPTHKYIGASAGCWAVYGEVLTREYSDFQYAKVHPLTVHAYAVQHPGVPSPQSIQSVTLHLVGLYVVFEMGKDPHESLRALQRAGNHKKDFVWLDPPARPASITVVDVYEAADAAEHAERVRRWARAVWDAWGPHHKTARRWAEIS